MIDKLDGLADIFFISVGALWKLKENPYEYIYKHHSSILVYHSSANIREEPYDKAHLTRLVNKIFETTDTDTLKVRIAHLINWTFKEFAWIGCEYEEAVLAINIICDSNDTKNITKLSDYDKGDLKGKDFINPHKRLKLLAEMLEDYEE